MRDTPGSRRARVALPSRLAAALCLCASLTLSPPAAAMALCTLEPSVLFAYPSLDVETTLPRNAEPFFVLAGTVQRAVLRWLPERDFTPPRLGTPFDRYRFDVGERLTPGTHDAELVLDKRSGSALVGPDTYPLRFHVSDAIAPEPDELGSVRITRSASYWRRVGGILRSDAAARAAARDEPTDCSAEVAIQTGCGGGRGWSPPSGEYRVELEAEGDVLGFVLDDRYFLPAHCRSAFVLESGPHAIRVVTEAGLGSESVYAGEVESVVSPDPDPLADPEPGPILWCSAGSPRGSAWGSGALVAALLAGALARRRAAPPSCGPRCASRRPAGTRRSSR